MAEVVQWQIAVAGEEGEVVLQQKVVEVGEEGQEVWEVVEGVVEEVVVVTEFDCLAGMHPGVCWGTFGQGRV